TVASAAGSLGLRHMSHYAAAKHGVIGFTRSLAADFAGTGVTANAVSPGSTTTAGLDESARIYGLESTEAFIRHQEPLGRLIAPDEIAAAAHAAAWAQCSTPSDIVAAFDWLALAERGLADRRADEPTNLHGPRRPSRSACGGCRTPVVAQTPAGLSGS
ncbi:MAG: SDR family oxidoreductase, partial [Acidimicrobiales bacterium]